MRRRSMIRCVAVGVFVVSLICMTAVTSASAQNDSLALARELSPRDGLPNFFAKLRQGKPVRVAFIGGSITRAGNGYRDQVLAWLRTQYPASRFEEIMAAVSGTGSDFGACRVRKHVIDHNPDLVFVEFAVNDNRRRMQAVRENMEGIVRQVWKANRKTDICFIYTFSNENLPLLQQGILPASASAMDQVATYYGIPSIHIGLAVIDEIKKGRMLMLGRREDSSRVPLFSIDGVHPLPETGHRIYTQVLSKNLLAMQSAGREGRHALPKALEAGNWSNAGMTALSWKQFNGDWHQTDSVTKGREYYQLLPQVFATSSDEAAVTVSFRGTRFGMADIMGPGTAALEISIDNQPPRTISRFDAFCTYYRLNYFIIQDLAPGKHTATIRLSKVPVDKVSILKTRNVEVKDPGPYLGRSMYIGEILY